MNTDCTTQENVIFDSFYAQEDGSPDRLAKEILLGAGAIAKPVRGKPVFSGSESAGSSWEILIPSVGSTDQTRIEQKKSVEKFSILSFSAVCEFCELRKGYDLNAMQHIYDLVLGEFAGYSEEYELAADDSGNPELILRIDTNNLSMQELIEKELRVFDVITRSITLSNANKYNILSIV